MADENADVVALADAISELLYGFVGWTMVVLGLFGVLVGVLQADQTLGLVVVIYSVLFVFAGVFVRPAGQQRLGRRRSVTSFGRDRTVDDGLFTDDAHTCAECAATISEGLVRRYREELLVAGIPVWTHSEGYNYYCPDCGTADEPAKTGSQNDTSDADQRSSLRSERA